MIGQGGNKKMAINIACCGYKNWLKAIADSGLKYVSTD